MTLTAIERRLAKIEADRGVYGDARWMTDAQLDALIRRSYASLRAEHGSLSAAIVALRATGDDGNAILANLIAEDIGGEDVAIH